MSERTFRSPSPGGVSPHKAPRPAAVDAPPVPAVSPEHKKNTVKPLTPLNIPQKGKPTQPRASSALARTHLDRERSLSPVNFSRPMSPTIDSRPTSPIRPKTAGGWHSGPTQTSVAPRRGPNARPHSSTGFSPSDASSVANSVQSAAAAPTKTKKKTGLAQQGARLASGTLSPAPQGTAVANTGVKQKKTAASAVAPQQPVARESKPKAAVVERQKSPSPSSPRRPSGLLHKQPSVVMEVPELEDGAEATTQEAVSVRKAPETQAKAVEKPKTSSGTRSSSASVSPRLRSRPDSLEVPDMPTRSAHFATEVESGGARHNPPGRSISPAKSAMKRSPSSSIRTASPATTFSPSNIKHPGSDTSDSMSITSQEGRKKKGVRVSFDEEAIAATAAPESPRTASMPVDDDADAMMKPRPALPSFGSVRGTSPRGGDMQHGPREPPKRSPEGASTDRALGSILRNAHPTKSEVSPSTNDPLPPEVTTVEGDGQLSDHSDIEDADKAEKWHTIPVVASTDEPFKQDIVTPEPVHTGSTIPKIEVMPATPANAESVEGVAAAEAAATDKPKPAAEIPEVATPLEERKIVPGAWNNADDATDTEADAETTPKGTQPSSAEPQKIDDALRSLQTTERPALARLPSEAESETEGSEAFSDAAEDQSDLEPFGYASMDAIVQSPVPASRATKREPESPVAPDISPSHDWTMTSAYWRNQKAQLARREPEQNNEDEDSDDTAKGNAPLSEKPKTVKAKAKAPTQTVTSKPSQNSAAASQAQPQKQLKSSMRTSMRDQISDDSSPQPAMRKTMRQTPGSEVRAVKERSMSADNKAAPLRKTMRPMSATRAEQARPLSPQAKPGKLMKPTDDSDSESSFKRKRRPSSLASEAGGYTMKRSMRSGPVNREQRPMSSGGVPSSGRWSVRSLSPTPTTTTFRQSLRGPSGGAPTLRGENSLARNKSPKGSNRFSISSLTKSSKNTRPASERGFRGNDNRLGSRFVDSDDEGDARKGTLTKPARGGFKSRFGDSDDENSDDEPAYMPSAASRSSKLVTPARPVDSEDELSDDEHLDPQSFAIGNDRATTTPMVPSHTDIDRAMAIARQNVANMTGNQELLKPQVSNSKMQKRGVSEAPSATNGRPVAPAAAAAAETSPMPRRRSFLGSIFGRRNSDLSRVNVPVPNARQAPAAASADTASLQGAGSTRGKLQRRTTPKMLRTASGMSTATANTVGSTQMAPVREDKDEANWPLPSPQTPQRKPVIAGAEGARPATSDGVPESSRTKVAPGGNLAGVSEEKSTPAPLSPETEKKKRFGKLRRAFGMK